jgi:hypothetical protein
MTVACGAAGLPDLQPCKAPTPIVVPSGASAADVEEAYRIAIVEGIDNIVSESLSFSGRHPRRELSNNASFRKDYVTAEQNNVCQAAALIALEPPAAYLEAFHADLSKALGDYIDTMAFGHSAVKSRNVSEFRAWDGREDSAIERLSIARDNIPAGP